MLLHDGVNACRSWVRSRGEYCFFMGVKNFLLNEVMQRKILLFYGDGCQKLPVE